MRRALLLVVFLFLGGFAVHASAGVASADVATGKELLRQGNFVEAEQVFEEVLATSPNDCEARYGLLLARNGILTDFVNNVAYRFDVVALVTQRAYLRELADGVDSAATSVEERGCTFVLDRLPFSVGVPEAPYAQGELRGRWDTDEALLLGAWGNIWQYVAAAIDNMVTGTRPDPAVLPPELRTFYDRMDRGFALLFSPAGEAEDAIVGWVDSDGSGSPTRGDRIGLRLFETGGTARVIDLSEADFFLGGWQPPTPPPPPVGGISRDPGLGTLPLETSRPSGPNAGVVAGIAAGVVVSTFALGGAVWWARRKVAGRWPRSTNAGGGVH